MNGQVVRIHASLADDMNAAVTGFMNYCRAKNLSPNTISYYRYRLQAFERFCADSPVAPENVTPERIREFLTAEAEEKSATLKAFFIQTSHSPSVFVYNPFVNQSMMSVLNLSPCSGS